MGEGGGFVEAEAGFWIGWVLIRVILDLMEEPIHHAQVKMEPPREPPGWGLRLEPKRWRKLTAPNAAVRRCGGTGLPQGSLEGPEQDVKDGAGGAGPVMEEGP